jgi:predicted transcriptional regulator
MDTPRVTESEYKLCLILWEHEPIKSAELVRLCEEKLGWKETTTYTVIKRLSDRGVVKNEKTIVSSLVPKSAIQAAQLDDLVERTFEGSLPAFIAAFTSRQRLSEKQIDEIQAMIDRCRRGEEL